MIGGSTGIANPLARLLSCPNCGAPLPAPDVGGLVRCAHCDVTATLDPRPPLRVESALLADPASPAERARVVALRKIAHGYDARRDPYSLNNQPSEFADVDGFDSKRETARRLERALRAPAPERTRWWIAERLVNLWTMRNDHVRAAAVAQTASELLVDRRFKQTMFTALADQARREDDFAAAATWLSQCDHAPTELSLDSDYRVSVAMLALARGIPAEALIAVGPVAASFPWAPQSEPMSRLARVTAHELLGQSSTADEDLREVIDLIEERTLARNSDQDPDSIRDACRASAVGWLSNTLTDSKVLGPARDVWARLARAGEIPSLADAVAAFRAQYR